MCIGIVEPSSGSLKYCFFFFSFFFFSDRRLAYKNAMEQRAVSLESKESCRLHYM